MQVNYDITPEGLVFTADKEDREEIQELYVKYQNGEERDYNWYALAYDVFEYALCNGLSSVRSEDVGALTASLIFSESSYEDDSVTFPGDGVVYWFPAYQVEDCIETLMDKGKVVFTRGM